MKDPAFLFYPSDFLTGTMFMDNEQIGIYIRLLCSQHQHGGIIDKISFNSLVKDNAILRSKFIETEIGFYNQRLADEMELRCKKSSNISQAVKDVWKKRKELQSNQNGIASNNNGIALKSKRNPKRKPLRIEDVDINEVIDYFTSKGYKKEAAEKFFEFYNTSGWVDSNGKNVLNWKQKANSIWFKDENKITGEKPKEMIR